MGGKIGRKMIGVDRLLGKQKMKNMNSISRGKVLVQTLLVTPHI